MLITLSFTWSSLLPSPLSATHRTKLLGIKQPQGDDTIDALTLATKMSALRLSRVAFRARPIAIRSSVPRRGYAEAVSDKIKLSLALPHQVRELPLPSSQP